ncbi:MAG: tyrosine-type recombinase/integrase [Deltaproteobacteria bacterium]|jgi:integrase|nr:tyrosine-type recombinase/integrase [Deltaproteobacteria bacterium]
MTKTKWGSLQASFRRAAIRAGLVYKDGSVCRIQDLRHDFLSCAGMANLNMMTIKEFAGHADVRSTQRYLHLTNDYLNEAYQLLDAKRNEREQPRDDSRNEE